METIDPIETMDSTEIIPMLPITSKRTLELCFKYPEQWNKHNVNNTDNNCSINNDLSTIFIASYPKSGTTWTQAIVYHLLTKGKQKLDHISSYSPFFEIDKTWEEDSNCIKEKYRINHKSIGWNVFNTHLLWHMMPKRSNMKYIYLVRHPYDVVVSFYYHLSNQADSGGFDGNFHEFLSQWVDGKIIFGNWATHLHSWMSKPSSQVLVVKYEDLIDNIQQELNRIVLFLELLDISDDILTSIAEIVSFESMKQNRHQYQPTSVSWKEGFNFLRKGIVGDGKTLLGLEEENMIKTMILKEFHEELPTWFPYTL